MPALFVVEESGHFYFHQNLNQHYGTKSQRTSTASTQELAG